MWYKKLYSIRKSFSVLKDLSLAYLDWLNDIFVSQKGKIFIKSLLLFALPVLLLLNLGFLDRLLDRELLAVYSLVYKEKQDFFKNYVLMDITKFKTKAELESFLNTLSENKPKLLVIDSSDLLSVPSNIRVVKTVSLPWDLVYRSSSWQNTYSDFDKIGLSINKETARFSVDLGKNVYGGGFLLKPEGFKTRFYIKVQNSIYYSLPMVAVKALESWDTVYYSNESIIAHKRKDNKIRSIKLSDGYAKINPFHNLSHFQYYRDTVDLKNKILIISNTSKKDLKLSGLLNITRAQYIALSIQELYSNELLPRISKGFIAFMIVLLSLVGASLNLLYRRRYKSLVFFSMLLFYVILSLFFVKVAQLYLSFIPVLLPYVLTYIYGIFFINRDAVSLAKGDRHLVLVGIDFIALDKHFNKLNNPDKIKDFYGILDSLRRKAIGLQNANAVVEFFDYSNKLFFLLEQENKFYGVFWESLQEFIVYGSKLLKNYPDIPHIRIIGVEGSFYFYPNDNFWTGEGKDLFFTIRKRAKKDLVFELNVMPNGFLNKDFEELSIDGYKLYGKDL